MSSRKKSLNLTDILYDTGHSPSHHGSSRKASSDDENLLNITNGDGLVSYIPIPPKRKSSREDVTLNYSLLSEDQELQYQIKEEELNKKIQELEQKLKTL